MIARSYFSTEPSRRTQETKLAFVAMRHSVFFGVARPAIDHITTGYALRNIDRVMSFIQDHSFLRTLLPEARHYINNYFPDSPLALEVITDPEGDTSVQLVISILTSLSPDVALERLDALDQEWWLNALPRARNKLSIRVEFA
jgi:hypothetical protein